MVGLWNKYIYIKNFKIPRLRIKGYSKEAQSNLEPGEENITRM
jgi:hypothetical protein